MYMLIYSFVRERKIIQTEQIKIHIIRTKYKDKNKRSMYSSESVTLLRSSNPTQDPIRIL